MTPTNRTSRRVVAPKGAARPARAAPPTGGATAATAATGVSTGSTPRGRPRRAERSRLGSALLRYGTAVGAVGGATLVTFLLLHVVFSRNPHALFYAAVVVAAWYGGIGPGLVATGLAAWAIDYFFLPSFLTFRNDLQSLVYIGTFALIAGLVSSLNAMRRRAMDELTAAKEQAEAANRAKDDFLAVLSHELRTPLTPALAASAALEKDPAVPPAVRQDVGMIRRNIELEAKLIDDLLDLTRITRGKLKLAAEPVNVHQLIAHVVEICRPDAEAKRLRLDVELACPGPWVHADAARLHQVLWNLIKNAVKFTPDGGTITVQTADVRGTAEPARTATGAAQRPAVDDGELSVAGEAPPDAGAAPGPPASIGAMVIRVRDTGIGIGAHVLPRIFEAFEQGDRTGQHRFGGLGLGLAISRALVVAHGGDLTAASDGEGRGATFALTLARVAAPAATAATAASTERTTHPVDPADVTPAAPALPDRPAARVRVLLVEDHPDTARTMARLLRSLGYDVRTADCVRAGLEQAAVAAFDLLISDLGLPDGTGIDLLLRLRERIPGTSFRAIALSGYGMEDDLRRTREAGFVAHLTKPITIEQLEAAIAAALVPVGANA